MEGHAGRHAFAAHQGGTFHHSLVWPRRHASPHKPIHPSNPAPVTFRGLRLALGGWIHFESGKCPHAFAAQLDFGDIGLSLMGRESMAPGDRVSVCPGLYDAIGTIVEDRGFIGAGGRRLWTVKVELDPPNVIYLTLPEAEMKAVQ